MPGTGRLRSARAPWLLWASVAVVAALSLAPTTLRGGSPTEYDVKGAFLYNFARFTSWPDAAFPDSNAPIRIVIVGEDPFGSKLDDALKGRRAKGRDIVVERVAAESREDFGHIVFLSESVNGDLDAILEAISGSPALTVSDLDGFVDRGGTIQFVAERKRIRFLINRVAEREADLQISANLLQLAKSVRE